MPLHHDDGQPQSALSTKSGISALGRGEHAKGDFMVVSVIVLNYKTTLHLLALAALPFLEPCHSIYIQGFLDSPTVFQ